MNELLSQVVKLFAKLQCFLFYKTQELATIPYSLAFTKITGTSTMVVTKTLQQYGNERSATADVRLQESINIVRTTKKDLVA